MKQKRRFLIGNESEHRAWDDTDGVGAQLLTKAEAEKDIRKFADDNLFLYELVPVKLPAPKRRKAKK